ncbi:MAG: outer membrane protein assembly factor BamA [Gemmatimonadaceae bacterium]|nr:outer membrane protein assembly factor BamA [Gemmatimonadaceae bacterium]
MPVFRHSAAAIVAAVLCLPFSRATAQQEAGPGACALPDSVAVEGNLRITNDQVLSDAELGSGVALNFKSIQKAIRQLYATGNFSDVRVGCRVHDGPPILATIVLGVTERPLLGDVDVTGGDRIPTRTLKDKVDLLIGRPVDAALVAKTKQRLDSIYEAAGYYLARVTVDTVMMGDQRAKVTFRVSEGRRLAVSGVRVQGLRNLAPADVVATMKTKPEGFLWFRKGEFDEDNFAGDLTERIPELLGKQGFIDGVVERDTLIVDRERGKGMIELQVREGPRYALGSFEALGNRRFSTEEIQRLYPFQEQSVSLTERARALLRRRGPSLPPNTFDQGRWDEGTRKVQTAYSNEGYIYARVRPIVDRDSTNGRHVANLRWEIEEGQPAIVNRVEILGNDHTVESCIRNALLIVTGDVFNQDRLIRSYQNLGNLGFFETPVPNPDTRPDSTGDVDIIFRVKEKQTGNVNFGASAGQGLGVGGFIGLQQPNLFGRCKSGSLNWNFGRYQNNFQASYTDPQIRLSQVSGTVNAYRTQNRYQGIGGFSNFNGGFGQPIQTGFSLQLGFPVPQSPYTRLFVSYGLESVRFGSSGFLGEQALLYSGSNVRSYVGATVGYDTRVDLPFASAGAQRTFTAQFNGLGGTSRFQRYSIDLKNYATLAQFGGSKPGSQPMKVVAGLSVRSGAVLGSAGAFRFTQQFNMGGVQYGEPLRGYPEFSITPDGFLPDATSNAAAYNNPGAAFFSSTAEIGLRLNSMFYVNGFFDAGNVYRRVQQFDPTRLFRGAGFGLSTVTPLGPLGLDWAYGMDRVDSFGRPAPAWQLHFRLGGQSF